jgi:Flp pilus assembly protein TadD
LPGSSICRSPSRRKQRKLLDIAKVFQQALTHHQAGRLPQAEAGYRQILAADPTHAGSLHLLGVIAAQIGRNDAALDLIGRAIKLRPQVADYHNDLGMALGRLGNIEASAASHREALRLNPNHPQAHNNLGNSFVTLQRFEEAEKCYRTALRFAPSYVEAHSNLAAVLKTFGRLDEAESHCRTALRVNPNYVEAHNNLGDIVRNLGRFDEAEACYREALRLSPHYAEVHYNLSGLLLVTGQLEEGWREYEWRSRSRAFPRRSDFAQPLWRGEDMGERVLLVHAEQGAGDTILFCRYAPLIATKARVVLEAPRSLTRLLSGLPGIAGVVASGEALPPFDLHCPLLSLPHVLGTTLDTIPNPVPYLQADPDQVAVWRDRLAAFPGLRVGLAWAGNPGHLDDRRRSIAVEKMSSLAGIPGVVFVSLQKDGGAVPPPSIALHDWTEEFDDFADTAALIQALDLVISVDTSVAHLAGALGKPVWLLNRFDPHWVWLLGRDDSPWYPTLRQFRQPAPNDWQSVLTAVRTQLERLVESGL